MKKIYILLFAFLFIPLVQSRGQKNERKYEPHAFLNIGIMSFLSLNGYDSEDMTNNISISLFYNNSKNIYGFSLAPFNYIGSSMHGMQIGISNGADKVRGVQIGFSNWTNDLIGTQIGFINYLDEKSGGLQIGILNKQKTGGLQIGLINLSDHNDYPIGFVNIIKNGEMRIGISTDEMSNVISTFRSGGKYLYGIAGIGYSFASSLNQFAIVYGLGAHYRISDRFRIDNEIIGTEITKIYSHIGDSEKHEERIKSYDFKRAIRLSLSLIPTYCLGKHIELFGGPTLNYLYSRSIDNKRIFPSNYIWREYSSHSLKQIYWGWTVGIQYKL